MTNPRRELAAALRGAAGIPEDEVWHVATYCGAYPDEELAWAAREHLRTGVYPDLRARKQRADEAAENQQRTRLEEVNNWLLNTGDDKSCLGNPEVEAYLKEWEAGLIRRLDEKGFRSDHGWANVLIRLDASGDIYREERDGKVYDYFLMNGYSDLEAERQVRTATLENAGSAKPIPPAAVCLTTIPLSYEPGTGHKYK